MDVITQRLTVAVTSGGYLSVEDLKILRSTLTDAKNFDCPTCSGCQAMGIIEIGDVYYVVYKNPRAPARRSGFALPATKMN